jgi:lipopolysaccharide export system protein LptC
LFVIVAQITIHALPYFDIENTTTMMMKGMLLLLLVVVAGAATPPPRTNGMTTTTTVRPTNTTLVTVNRHVNPYLKMQALRPTPR